MHGEVKTYFLTPEELEKERKRLGYNPKAKKKEVNFQWPGNKIKKTND